jgi:hypothetical protein
MTQQTGWGNPPQQFAPQQPAPWGQPPAQAPYQPQGFPAQGGFPQQGFPQQPPAGPTQSAEDFFMGGGRGEPSFDWGATQNAGNAKLGATIKGVITEIGEPTQQTDMATKAPKFFPDGQRRMQVAITLQTEMRNWEGVKPDGIPMDDQTGQPKAPHLDQGLRRIFVKGDMQRAVKEAAKRDLQRAPQPGDSLAVVVDGFKPTGQGKPMTLYKAAFQKGGGAGAQTLMAGPAEQQPAATFNPQAASQGQPAWGQQGQPAPQQQQPQFGQYPQGPTGQPVDYPPQQPPAPQGPPPGYEQPQGQGYVQNGTGQPEPIQQPPGQNPSTLGNSPAPSAPPGWAAPPSETGF